MAKNEQQNPEELHHLQIGGTAGQEATGCSMSSFLEGCQARLEQAKQTFQKTYRSPEIELYVGRFPGLPVISMMWIQEFEEDQTASVQRRLHSMFYGEEAIAQAKEWDSTFQSATCLSSFQETHCPEPTLLIHWKFSAAPLAPRDLLYLLSYQETPTQTLYGYPSVSNDWANEMGIQLSHEKKRVKGAGLFQSSCCASLTVRRSDK